MSKFQIVYSGMDEYLSAIKNLVKDLSPSETRWQASMESNHIDWLVWHIGRVEDGWMNRTLGGGAEIWYEQEWNRKFSMDSEGSGFGQNMEDVRRMPNIEMKMLLGYLDAVRAQSSNVLLELDENKLHLPVERKGRDPVTGVWILGHVLVEESQHVGQIGFIRGLLRGLNS